MMALKKNSEDAWNLIETYPELREEVINRREVLFYKVLPFLLPDLDKSSVLACRQVCKSWRTIVDQFLDKHPSQKPYQPEASFLNETGYPYCTLQDKNMEFMMKCVSSDFEDKLSVMAAAREANVASPSILGRSASFFFDNWAVIQELGDPIPMLTYYNSLCTLLERIGSTIEIVSIPLTGAVHLEEDVARYEGFARCLGLLPNLKSLTVDTPHSWIHNGAQVANSETRQQFFQVAQNSPLAELRTLKIFKSKAEPWFPCQHYPFKDICLQILITYGNQIEKLCIDPFAVGTWEQTLTQVQLGSLMELQILGMRTRVVGRVVELLQNVDTAKLKKIEFYDPRIIPRDEIFYMLERFQQLEVFVITSYKNYFAREDEELPTFPSVKALKLHIAQPTEYIANQNPFDNPASRFPGMFLLNAFPNLEFLEIQLMDENFKNLNDVQFYQEDEIGVKMLQCKVYMGVEKQEMKIWELLPRLKKFIVGNKHFDK